MATDLEKLVVQLSADIRKFDREIAKINGIANRQFRAVENRARQMNKNLDAIFSRSVNGLMAPLAGIGAALSVQEVARYADAWTVAGNKLASAGQVAGMQARSLQDLNKIANDTRSGISETADLYAKLMRSTKGVAQSELEVAKATEIVNKAFKAGGAAASEQAAGILQLGQGLGSGMLQGDELRSVRENAPMLAQAIADYFKVSIAGLKDLGSEGKLTSDKVFKAILAAQPQIEAAFKATNSTISDGLTKVNNAMTQYVGETDKGLDASQRLIAGLNALADNFDSTADIVLKLATIIAGALVGRSIVSMVRGLGLATSATLSLIAALRTASSLTGMATAFGGIGAAAGPLGMIIGGTVVGALALYSSNAAEASTRSQEFESELERLGLLAPEVADGIDKAAEAVIKMGDAKAAQKIRSIADEIDRIRTGGNFGDVGDELSSIAGSARGGALFRLFDDDADRAAREQIAKLAYFLQQMQLTSAQVKAGLDEIRATPISDGVKDLADELDRSAEKITALQAQSLSLGVMPGLEDAKAGIDDVLGRLDQLERMELITAEQRKNLETALKKLRDTGQGADDVRAALASIGSVGFSTTLSGLDALVGKVTVLYAQADAARRLLAGMGNGGISENSKNAYLQFQNKRTADDAALRAGKAFTEEAKRRNALTKDQLALEKAVLDVRNELAKTGGYLSEDQITSLAQANLDADARRSASGKSPRKSRDTRSPEQDFSEDLQSITDRTAALIAETEAQRQINPLIDDYGYAIEKARVEQDLLNAAQKAGVAITPELRAQIAATAEQFALATQEAGQLAEAQDKIRQNAEEMVNFQKDLTRGIVDGFIQGKKAADIFADALSNIGNKLLDMAFDGLFDSKSGGGGLLGGIGKLFGFADGGYTGAGGKYQPAGVVHKGEVVWSQADVARAGGVAAVEAMRRGVRGYSAGGAVAMPVLKAPTMPILKAPVGNSSSAVINFAPVINAPNADKEGLARVEGQLTKMRQELPAIVVQTVRESQSKFVKLG